MSEYDALVFATIFITAYWFLMVPFGGAEVFTQDFDVSEEDLQIAPDIETPDDTQIEPGDYVSQENLTVINSSDIDQEHDYPEVIGLQDGETSGEAIYRVPEDTVEVTYYTTYGLLGYGCGVQRFVGHMGEEESRSTCGVTTDDENTMEPPEEWDSNEVRIEITDEDAYLYNIEARDATTYSGITGFITQFFLWTGSVLGYIYNLIAITVRLPIYMSLPFGIYLGYLLYEGFTMKG